MLALPRGGRGRSILCLLCVHTQLLRSVMASPAPERIPVHRLRWRDAPHVMRQFVKVPTMDMHKGQMGRIGVLGGSEDYTGAPFYAAYSALKFGADLAYVFCAKEAATPIKSYSPELMVTAVYDADRISREPEPAIAEMVEKVTNMFSRMHVLVVGPGLGRKPEVLAATKQIIQRARAESIPVVIDADGLFLVSQDPDLIRDAKNIVITPNPVELKRIAEAVQLEVPPDGSCEDFIGRTGLNAAERVVVDLSRRLGGVTVLRKGRHDIISDGTEVLVSLESGSPRRSGGQGDILAGVVAVARAWLQSDKGEFCVEGEADELVASARAKPQLWAALTASMVVKTASSAAFAKHKRAMTAPDVIQQIGASTELLAPLP